MLFDQGHTAQEQVFGTACNFLVGFFVFIRDWYWEESTNGR